MEAQRRARDSPGHARRARGGTDKDQIHVARERGLEAFGAVALCGRRTILLVVVAVSFRIRNRDLVSCLQHGMVSLPDIELAQERAISFPEVLEGRILLVDSLKQFVHRGMLLLFFVLRMLRGSLLDARFVGSSSISSIRGCCGFLWHRDREFFRFRKLFRSGRCCWWLFFWL